MTENENGQGSRARIAELEKANAESERLRSLLEAAFDATADGILVVDGDRITAYNQRFADMWGIPAEILDAGDDSAAIASIVHLLSDPNAVAAGVTRAEQEPEVEFTDVIELLDGRVFQRRYAPQRLNGAIVGKVWSIQNVTERLRAEERFRNTLESVSLIAAGIDEQGVVTFANDFLLELTGWERDEVIGHDWFARFDSDPAVRADYFDCMERREIHQHFESAIRTRSGEERMIRWSSTLELAADGSAAGIVTIGEDVTEQRQSDELLREREEYYRTLIENASDVISVLDAEGTSLYESPSVERVLGWRPDELVGTRSYVLRHPDDADQIASAVAAILAGEQVPPFEFRLRHKDGTWRTVEATARLRVQGGERVIVSNYRDVTERRELQEQLLHAQKLEAVGRLAGGIAHDFNNLLTAIGGYAEFLIGGFDAEDARREDALEIQRAAERAAALTRQLLAFSRRQVLQPETLDLAVVVAEIESLLDRLLGEEVELSSNIDPGCFVEADRGQLEQVITNLTVNARDAMPAGGRLAISGRLVEHEGEPHVELAVADTGTGMDTETLAHLFEPFYTTKDKGKGTGLGLATVYGIVAQSGGDVLVESELEHGSRFRVLLPLVEAAKAKDEPAAEPQLALPGAETILLVEDEDTIRKLVRDVLTRGGYTVLVAPGGEAALELLRANEVDLLLTDVVMPGMSGPDLARIATSERPSIRVLFTSGYTNEPEELHAEPDAAFIGKPFSPQSLVAKVREVLDAR